MDLQRKFLSDGVAQYILLAILKCKADNPNQKGFLMSEIISKIREFPEPYNEEFPRPLIYSFSDKQNLTNSKMFKAEMRVRLKARKKTREIDWTISDKFREMEITKDTDKKSKLRQEVLELTSLPKDLLKIEEKNDFYFAIGKKEKKGLIYYSLIKVVKKIGGQKYYEPDLLNISKTFKVKIKDSIGLYRRLFNCFCEQHKEYPPFKS